MTSLLGRGHRKAGVNVAERGGGQVSGSWERQTGARAAGSWGQHVVTVGD